jgi:ferrous iron transport protein B
VSAVEPPSVVLLVGRPNAGKSSLFNLLTGGDAKVGNFPGVTVERLEAELTLPEHGVVRLVDLPGTYTIAGEHPEGSDEAVAVRALGDALAASRERIVIVQVLDATQLAAGLELTRELAAEGAPLLCVATQRDILEREGRALDERALELAIGARFVQIDTRAPASRDVVLRALDDVLTGRPRAEASFVPERLASEAVREVSSDAPALAARTRTERVDRWLLHPLLGPVLFVAGMALLFASVFLVADPVKLVLDLAMGQAAALLGALVGEGRLRSFLVDGLLGGAGTVLGFLPQVVILTVALEAMEASGYLARGAFLVDRLFRSVGLGGASFVPLLSGHACAVPAITATRVVKDPAERLRTILVLPLMTCSARIPTYGLLIVAFFSGSSALEQAAIFVALYFAGIASGLVASLALKKAAKKGRTLPLLLEMPPYRTPRLGALWRVGARTARRFALDVGTTILALSAVLWGLLHVEAPWSPPAPTADGATVEVPAIERSVAASLGRALEPVTAPLGFDWRINVGLIGSFGARELMVGTLGVVYGVEGADEAPEPLQARLREAKTPPTGRRATIGAPRPRCSRSSCSPASA